MSQQQSVQMSDLGDDRKRHKHRRKMNLNLPGRTRPAPTTTTITSSNSQRLAQHMTIAGSFLDFALFVADVEHLKYLLDVGKENVRYFQLLIILIGTSLALQVVVVILMFIVGFRKTESTTVTHHQNNESDDEEYDPNDRQPSRPSFQDQISLNDPSFLNRIIIILVTFIAIINVFVTVFGDRTTADLMQKYRAGRNLTQEFMKIH